MIAPKAAPIIHAYPPPPPKLAKKSSNPKNKMCTMWTDYEPTPLTRKYLVEEGYLPK